MSKPNERDREKALGHLTRRWGTFEDRIESLARAFAAEREDDEWQPIETAPINESVLIWLPQWEHYGPGIYRAILVDMGTGQHWHTTAWSCGRDLSPGDWPELWMPLPKPPVMRLPGAVPGK